MKNRLVELDVENHIQNIEIFEGLEDNFRFECVIPISGGKDSQACLKLALEKFDADKILCMFCDTKYEHPLTYEHVDKISKMYGVKVVVLNDGDVYSRIRKYGRFPSDNVRFCTDQLKIRVGKIFYNNLSLAQESGFEVWYGMRLGESYARSERYKDKSTDSLYPPHEIMINKYPKYLTKQGVMFRLPILTWEEEDVFNLLSGEENQLYKNGFDRVGCFPCLASGDRSKERAFSFDEYGRNRRIEVIQLGHEIGKNIFTSKGGRIRNPDSDPENKLSYDHTANQDDSPCFHCNI